MRMTNKRSAPRSISPLQRDSSQILVGDVSQYLAGLAKLHGTEKTGNMALSGALRQLVDTLRPYARVPMSELDEIIKQTKRPSSVRPSNPPKTPLPNNLESIGRDEIQRMLAEGDYSKLQIAQIGARRFGMSRSKLVRLRKQEAEREILAAIEHEKSLEVISQEARHGGLARAPVARPVSTQRSDA